MPKGAGEAAKRLSFDASESASKDERIPASPVEASTAPEGAQTDVGESRRSSNGGEVKTAGRASKRGMISSMETAEVAAALVETSPLSPSPPTSLVGYLWQAYEQLRSFRTFKIMLILMMIFYFSRRGRENFAGRFRR